MLNLKQWAAGVVISLCCPFHAFSYIPSLLDSNADSFNERIWSGAPISVEQVQHYLSFLEEADPQVSQYATMANSHTFHEPKIEHVSDKNLKSFFSTCKTIYNDHADIDPVTQAAVAMLFERTLEKYTAHEALLQRTQSFLPSIKSPIDEAQSVSVMTRKNPIDIPAEYQAQFDLLLAETINNIARNFFPDVDQGKLTLETLSSRCGQQVEFLRQLYDRYHNHNKKESS